MVVNITEEFRAILDRIGCRVPEDRIAAITIEPGRVVVTEQLLNEAGSKYVWGTAGDPNMARGYFTRDQGVDPLVGHLAVRKRTYFTTTDTGEV